MPSHLFLIPMLLSLWLETVFFLGAWAFLPRLPESCLFCVGWPQVASCGTWQIAVAFRPCAGTGQPQAHAPKLGIHPSFPAVLFFTFGVILQLFSVL